jgi:hypothetical protein
MVFQKDRRSNQRDSRLHCATFGSPSDLHKRFPAKDCESVADDFLLARELIKTGAHVINKKVSARGKVLLIVTPYAAGIIRMWHSV